LAAAGEWGNAKRGTRGSHPRAHLELGRREEMDRPWRTERGGGARGGDAVELGEDLWMLDCGVVWRGRLVLAFYRRPKVVPGRNISTANSTPAQAVVDRGGSSGPAGPGRRATGWHRQGRRSSCRRRVSSILWRRGGRPAGPAGGSAGGGDAAV
jgi:hypothetical protein